MTREQADKIVDEIRERLHGEIRGFVAFPDDIEEWLMPIIGEEVRKGAAE